MMHRLEQQNANSALSADACRNCLGPCQLASLNAMLASIEAAMLIATTPAQNRADLFTSAGGYGWLLGDAGIGTSTSPGTFITDGAKRPPAASPPGSGR